MSFDRRVEKRKNVLLELAAMFLDGDEYNEIKNAVLESNFSTVEYYILVNIDLAFESKRINGKIAREAYLSLGLSLEDSLEIRKDFHSNTVKFLSPLIN